MVTSQADLAPRWTLRDWVAASALFAATAGIVIWQNTHVAVLFDLSYILNTATRIAQGQMPYRDFPLAHAPLTFLFQAIIIRLTGRVFFHHVIYVALTGGFGTVLTWRIALETLRGRVRHSWTVALLVAAPITVLGVYCIVPNPEYDCDCGFWIVVALWMLQRLDSKTSPAWGFATGAALCVPLFFKQNMGLPFLAAALCGVGLIALIQWLRQKPAQSLRVPISLLAGAGTALIAALLVLHWTAGLDNYVRWTIHYAAQRRLPGSNDMLGVYSDPWLLWMVPCIGLGLVLLRTTFADRRALSLAALVLLSAPFLCTLASLLVYRDIDTRADRLLALWPLLLLYSAALAIANLIGLWREPRIRTLLPLIVLAAIHGTFMSQQLWGSTYGIWPLLAVLLAELTVVLERFTLRSGARQFVPALSAVICCTLIVCGSIYTFGEERLSYADLPAGPPVHSAFQQLRGLGTPGPYLPEFDELVRYADANIPFDDGLVLLPGEEPFYFVTGREARFPVPFFDPTIDPYSPAEVVNLVRQRNIRWLIVKRNLQTRENPAPDAPLLTAALLREFTPVARLRGYDVHRR